MDVAGLRGGRSGWRGLDCRLAELHYSAQPDAEPPARRLQRADRCRWCARESAARSFTRTHLPRRVEGHTSCAAETARWLGTDRGIELRYAIPAAARAAVARGKQTRGRGGCLEETCRCERWRDRSDPRALVVARSRATRRTHASGRALCE